MKEQVRKLLVIILSVCLLANSLLFEGFALKAAGTPDWMWMSDAEMNAAKASYNEGTDSITFVNDWGWANRMYYTKFNEAATKSFAVEFDLVCDGGLVGVYTYDATGAAYGVYIDTNAAQLDRLIMSDWFTMVDDFNFREITESKTPHANIAGNWNGTTDKTGHRLRFEFIVGAGGTLAGGVVRIYKRTEDVSWTMVGEVPTPEDITINEGNRYVGIQTWIGTATVSDMKVTEIDPDEKPMWAFYNQDEANLKYASYNTVSNTMHIANQDAWATRMYTPNIKDASSKDYAIEFDLTSNGGLLGVYTFDQNGAVYGVFLDTNAAQLDRLIMSDWITMKDDFAFRESWNVGGPQNGTVAAVWNGATDKTGSRIRFEYIRGAGGKLAGGKVRVLQKKTGSLVWTLIGEVSTPADIVETADIPRYFGIMSWIGENTCANITVEEFTPEASPEWVYLSDTEKAENLAVYESASKSISFTNSNSWFTRMKHATITDASTKDYAIEFNLNSTGGLIGAYTYDDSGALYGVYLDVWSKELDMLNFSDWVTCTDHFAVMERDQGWPQNPVVSVSGKWDGATDNTGNRIRIEIIHGEDGKLAGGVTRFYKRKLTEEHWHLIGEVATPTTITEGAGNRYLGLQCWIGQSEFEDITVEEIDGELTIPWVNLSSDEAAEEYGYYNPADHQLEFKNDNGWYSRLKNTSVTDALTKDYAVEFDLTADGGLVGVFTYDDTGAMYGVYLDTVAAQLDRLSMSDWMTMVDDFNFRESGTQGATVHENVSVSARWDGAADKTGKRIRVEIIHGADGTLKGGKFRFYKKTVGEAEFMFVGEMDTPTTITENAGNRYIGIQTWIGNATLENVTVEEFSGELNSPWANLSTEVGAETYGRYNWLDRSIVFTNDSGWNSRVKSTSITDADEKDYAIEFDLTAVGGLIGAFTYDDTGAMYGAYLDVTAGQLDRLSMSDWTTMVDDFNFRESTTQGATVHPNVDVSARWSAANDKTGKRIRIEIIRGANSTLAGGKMRFYKKAESDTRWTLIGEIDTPSNITLNDGNRYLGLQAWIGNATLKNVTVESFSGKLDNPWVNVNTDPAAEEYGYYDINAEKITFKNTDGWDSRVKNTKITDANAKDYAVEFDLSSEGGLIGVFTYDDDGALYGAFLDTTAAQLDRLIMSNWTTMVDDFNFREAGTQGATVHENKSVSARWIAANDKTGKRIRVEIIRGADGKLAGGKMRFYKKAENDTRWTIIGELDTPANIVEKTGNRYIGIQSFIGNNELTNVTVEAFEGTLDIPWENLNQELVADEFGYYDLDDEKIVFKYDEGWNSRMKNTKITDALSKNYAVEFDLTTSGGLIGVFTYDDTGALYGAYLDTMDSSLDRLNFTNWTNCTDDFKYRESNTQGATVHSNVKVSTWDPSSDLSGKRIRIEVICGAGGTLAGGWTRFYKKAEGDTKWTFIGQIATPEDITVNAGKRYIGIQSWIGNATLSNITVNECVAVEPEIPVWDYLGNTERKAGKALYDEEKNEISITYDDGWNSRMYYVGITDADEKDYVVEFDLVADGGVVGIFTYDENGAVIGAYLDTVATFLDKVSFTNWTNCTDDFYFRESTTQGATLHPTVAASNWGAADLAGTKIRIELVHTTAGTQKGGEFRFYKKGAADIKYTALGTVKIPTDITEGTGDRMLGIQGWIGNMTLSNITVSEYVPGTIDITEMPKWAHVNGYEQEQNKVTYDKATDTITFQNYPEGWSGRLYNSETIIHGTNFAVEFDANVGNVGNIGVQLFEDSYHFYGVYYDMSGILLDGAGMAGYDTVKNKEIIIDDFVYVNDTIYPHFGIDINSPSSGENVTLRYEFFNGKGGTLAGGTAHIYFKQKNRDEWVRLGTLKLPTTITNDPEVDDRVMIHGQFLDGTISNIKIYTGISSPALPYSDFHSEKWEHASKDEKNSLSASYNDETDVMNLKFDSVWNSRMFSKTAGDVSGKCFAIEADTSFNNAGGMIGFYPFFEDANNWYCVYVDRAANKIDGAGMIDGVLIDDFDYVNASLNYSVAALTVPLMNSVRMRYEFFTGEEGAAAGRVRIFYKQMANGELLDEKWRYVGEFYLPYDLTDRADVANRIGLGSRVLSCEMTNIVYGEIDPDTDTEYYTDEPDEPVTEPETEPETEAPTESESETEAPTESSGIDIEEPTEPTPGDDGGENKIWILFVGLGAAAAIAAVVLLLTTKKKKIVGK